MSRKAVPSQEALRSCRAGSNRRAASWVGASPERVRVAYSTEDWERLVALKDKYDPNNTFRFGRNIPPSGAVVESSAQHRPVGEAIR